MDFKKPVFMILAIVALIVAIVWNYAETAIKNKQEKAKQEQEQQVVQSQPEEIINLTNLKIEDFKQLFDEEYALANSKAIEAVPNNRLCGIEVNIASSLEPATVNSRYIYTTSSEARDNWVFTIQQSSQAYIRASIPKEDYAGNLTQIDTQKWQTSYLAALQAAEKAGGLQWRETNLSNFNGMRLTLKTDSAKKKPVWEVVYLGNFDVANFIITLDAETGKALGT